MGYRSTMILGIAPKHKEEFDKTNEDDAFKLVKEEDDMLIYEGEYLKWYDEFTEVKDINAMIEKGLKDNLEDSETFLVGVAEDGKIHSEMGDWYDYVGISTIHEIY